MDKHWRPADHPKPRRNFVFNGDDEFHPTRGYFFGLFHSLFHGPDANHSRYDCELENAHAEATVH